MRKRKIAEVRYANVVLQRVVWESRRKQSCENAVLATEYLLEMSAMPTTVDPARSQASLCVQIFQKSEMQQSHVAPKKEARRSRVEERSAGTEKSLLTQTNTNAICEADRESEEDSVGAHSKRIKKKMGKESEDRFLRRCIISQEVEEEEENTEGDAGKNIYFSI